MRCRRSPSWETIAQGVFKAGSRGRPGAGRTGVLWRGPVARRTVVLGALALVGCGSSAGQDAVTPVSRVTAVTAIAPSTETLETSETAAPSVTLSTVTTTSPAGVVAPSVYASQIEIPSGEISVGPNDLFIVHADGDLWLHPEILAGSGMPPFRLADLGDPRAPVTEGPGPNAVDKVAGVVNGVVFYGDCCEPIAGNILGATRADSEGIIVGYGYSPVISPSGDRLASANGFGLTVIELSTGVVAGREINSDSSYINVWDLMWSADGRSLIMLYFDDSGFALMPYNAETPFVSGKPVSLDVGFNASVKQDVGFAGRGPNGEIAVSIGDDEATLIRYFDGSTLAEIPEMQRSLPAGVHSVRLATDGEGLIWIDKNQLWYVPAGGDVRNLGAEYAAAWFAQ